jgi:uncharacterized membrane protein
MGKDLSDVIGTALGHAAREAIHDISAQARKRSRGSIPGGPKGVAAGVGLMALAPLAPLAGKGLGKLVSGAVSNGGGALKDAGEKVKDQAADAVPGKELFSKGGGSRGGSGGVPGVGKGRRMPVQQDIDIGAPLKTVYNQWTQFEEWPKFMHRVQQVSQEDENTVRFKTKISGVSKEFTAEILEQRPDERIKWRVKEGVTHTGVVTFHELGPRLTRVELNFDVEPGSLIEKAARGMRFVKRAARADLARFKAYVLMQEEETGAWRGRIEDGDVKRASSGRGRSTQGGASKRTRAASNGSSRAGRASSRSSSSKRTRGATNGSGRSSSRSGSSKGSSKRTRGATNGSGRSSSRSGSSKGSSKRTRGAANGASRASSRSSSAKRTRGAANGSSRASSRSSSSKRTRGAANGSSRASSRSSSSKRTRGAANAGNRSSGRRSSASSRTRSRSQS